MFEIPFLDVGASYAELKSDIDSAIHKVLDSHVYILGAEVREFEDEFAQFVEANHCVGVGNGLEALRLALRAVGVGPNDEVIVPGHTFIATWLAVTQTGAVVVPVEPNLNDYNLSPLAVEAAITSRTKAIVIVHLYGQPAPLDELLEVGRRYGIPVVEDAAQAHGATYKDKKIGAHSDAVAWSFYPSKNLGAFGDAGAVTTNSAEIADQVRIEANYGSKVKYEHNVLGTNSRLDPIQAAVLRIKLHVLDEWNNRRQNLADTYAKNLNTDHILLPQRYTDQKSVWHLYVIQVQRRDQIRERLIELGIETGVHYPLPPHRQLSYIGQYGHAELSRCAQLSESVLSLPMGPHLDLQSVRNVAEVINDLVSNPILGK